MRRKPHHHGHTNELGTVAIDRDAHGKEGRRHESCFLIKPAAGEPQDRAAYENG